MHTTRNHIARKSGKAARAIAARAPVHPPPHDDAPFMLRQRMPAPSFPADLIVPPHRGAVITQSALPDTPERRLGRKAAKREARKAAAIARARQAATAPESAPESLVLAEPAPPVELAPAPAAAVAPPAAADPAPIVEESPAVPLPAGRALVARRQGFVDILAHALRNSGLRLARWSSAKRRADEMKEKLAKAEARMRAMEAQLAALQAIQQRVR